MPESKKPKPDASEDWRKHRFYSHGVSFNRIVTRSQTGFNRLKHTTSNNDLFLDKSRFQPPGLSHIMVAMKGKFGAIPMTIITRSTAQHLGETAELMEMLEKYKKSSSSSES